MTDSIFRVSVATAGLAFLILFAVVVVPPFVANPDIIGAFAAGFVNPYASGYSADTILCWVILSLWILHERRQHGVKHGLWCIPLGAVPGVAVAFAAYLLLRMGQRESD